MMPPIPFAPRRRVARWIAASALFAFVLSHLHADPTAPKPAPTPPPPAAPEKTAWRPIPVDPAAEKAVRTIEETWTDAKRSGRQVPVKIYLPAEGTPGPWPVIVISHGLGGSREGIGYLGRYFAARGCVAVHPQHAGSDSAIWQGALIGGGGDLTQRKAGLLVAAKAALANPTNALERPRDISFVIDQLTARNAADAAPSPFRGQLDLKHIAVAGHSFGAWTAQTIAGQVMLPKSAAPLSMADPRVEAAIILSPTVGGRPGEDAATEFAGVKIPCLSLTGTKDDSPVSSAKADSRRIPFDHIKGVDEYLVTFDGANHMSFGGGERLGLGRGEADREVERLVCLSAGAFFDAYVLGNPAAREWLRDPAGLKKSLGGTAILEIKPPVPGAAKP